MYIVAVRKYGPVGPGPTYYFGPYNNLIGNNYYFAMKYKYQITYYIYIYILLYLIKKNS